MRVLRILLGVLAILFAMAVVTVFLAAPNWIISLVNGTLPEPGTSYAARLFLAIVIDFILFYLGIYLPLVTTNRSGGEHGLIVQKGQGRAYIDPESVRQQIYNAVTKVPEVEHAEVSVGNQHGGAAINVTVVTDNTINAPRKKQELRREIRKVVEDQLGVRLAGEPAITMSLTPAGTSQAPSVSPKTALPEPPASRPAMATPSMTPAKPAPVISTEPKPETASTPLFRKPELDVKEPSPASDEDEDEAEPVNKISAGGPAADSKPDLPASMPE